MDQNLRVLFERALSDEPLPPPGDLARDAMASGRRRRRRRHLLAGGVASVTIALAAVVTVNVASTPPSTPTAMSLAPRPECSQAVVPPAEITLFLDDDVTDAQRTSLDRWLRSDARVQQARYESRETAYETFKQMYRHAPDLVAAIKPGQLPEAFRVTLTERSGHLEFIEDAKRWQGVETVIEMTCVRPGEGE